MNEKCLIFIDVLGFDEYAQEIAEVKKIDVREVRNKFFEVIEKKIAESRENCNIIGSSPGRDDIVIVLDDKSLINPLNSCFKLIGHLLKHNTGYKSPYNQFSLEIGIGIGLYDEYSKFNGKDLLKEQSTIDFLKLKFIDHYHIWYKQNHGCKIKESFVILTEDAYSKLNPIDKKFCMKIEHNLNNTNTTRRFYYTLDMNFVKNVYNLSMFLNTIGIIDNPIYNRIDYLFVPPLEYCDIFNFLSEKRILFLTGSPEFGKTYTAIYLLFRYFEKGYIPRWIHGEELHRRIEVRDALDNISAFLKPKHIIYFEDPFGKIEYEKRESLERDINTIINYVESLKDVYVIITSREEIFKKFKIETASRIILEQYEKKINLFKPSYDQHKKEEILEKWAEYNNCKWVFNQNLKGFVHWIINYYKELLPTPLSIKDFTFVSKNTRDEEQLYKLLKRKSLETSIVFGKEISAMSDNKKLFLGILMITDPIDLSDFNLYFNQLKSELKISSLESFNDIIEWFNGDKITIKTSEDFDPPYESITFTHPSYLEAVDFLLQEDKIFRKFFIKCLDYLVKKEETLENVSKALNHNYIHLPMELRHELLLDLSNYYVCLEDIIPIFLKIFNNLDEDLRDEILRNIMRYEEYEEDIYLLITENYRSIPNDIKREFWKRLSDNDNYL